MSWKPSRSSGIMFSKFSKKAEDNRMEYFRMIETREYLRFENLNKFSRHLYLYWLNENKNHCALVSSHFDNKKPFYTIDQCSHFPPIMPMLKRYSHLTYKPFKKMFC